MSSYNPDPHLPALQIFVWYNTFYTSAPCFFKSELIFPSLFIHIKCGVPLLWYLSHFSYTTVIHLDVAALRENPISYSFLYPSKSLTFIRCSVNVG